MGFLMHRKYYKTLCNTGNEGFKGGVTGLSLGHLSKVRREFKDMFKLQGFIHEKIWFNRGMG